MEQQRKIEEGRMNAGLKPLMTWFQERARTLPWRSNPVPYWVWVSEIMLQQTRVEAVKPYFDRFMKTFPRISDLAGAEDEMLMKLWEGLGYYSRARNLKKAAILCVEQYDAALPERYEELLRLPGIGSYTAGAIASIAYGWMVPAVDGNVLRVISRLFASRDDIGKAAVKKRMEEELKAWMEQSHPDPGQFNQALMELGATVCLPNGMPHCDECPWNAICLAKEDGLISQIPVKMGKKARRIEKKTIFLIEEGGRMALHKRPDQGLLAGLYELPNVEGHLSAKEAQKLWENRLHCPVSVEKMDDGKHVFSHIEWHMKGYRIVKEGGDGMEFVRETPEDIFFVSKQEVQERYALPSAFAAWSHFWKKEK